MGPKRLNQENKDYCKRYRMNHLNEYRSNDANRKRHQRLLNKTTNPLLHEELKKKNRERMRCSRDEKRTQQKEESRAAAAPEQEASAFSTKQSRCRSMRRAEDGLPKSPNKKMEVIGSLAKKYQIRIAFATKRGRKYEDLSEKEVEWLKIYMERPEMTYINPGKKDHVYVGKIDGKSSFVQKQYLLWTLRDTLDIINGNELEGGSNETSFNGRFGKMLSFGRLYNFFKVHKQYVWNRDIPESSCLCEICENACLLAKGINKHLKLKLPTTPHDLVERFSCGRESSCMNNICKDCVEPKWEVGNGQDEDECHSNDEDSSVTFYRWGKAERTQKLCVTMDKDETWETWCEVIKGLKSHIYRKREQVLTNQ